MNNINLRFPVVALTKSSLYFARDENDLTVCNKIGLRNGFYKNLLVLDVEGNQRRVIDAKKIGTVGGIFGYNLFLEQKIKVELIFDEMHERLNLHIVKEKILKFINMDKSFWNADGQLKDRYDFIESANSIQEIIEKFTTDFYKEYK